MRGTQVVCGEMGSAAIGADGVEDRLGNGARIERLGAVLGDQPQRLGLLRQRDAVADLHLAAAQESFPDEREPLLPRWIVAIRLDLLGGDARVLLVHEEPLLGQPDGRREDGLAVERAVVFQRVEEPRDAAGHADGGRPARRRLSKPAIALESLEVVGPVHRSRRGLTVVQRDRARAEARVAIEVDHHESAAPDPAGGGPRDGKGERSGDGRIDGIAMVQMEHLCARLRRRRV
jgi:hypothetical protein